MSELSRCTSPVEQRNSYSMRDDVVERELLDPDRALLFEEMFGHENYTELRDLANKASSRAVRGGPRVLILPGIMGSKLGIHHEIFDQVIWFNPVQIAAGRLVDLKLNGTNTYTPVGVILLAYLKLKFKLRLAGFDADFHPFDWRQSLADTGAALAERVAQEKRPVSLVCHSMGGLAARAAIGCGAVVEKIIQLGTPNRGSFAPVQVLRATYDTVVQLARLDLFHTAKDLSDGVLKTFPGLYEMLPFPDAGIGVDLFAVESWPDTDPRPIPERLAAARAIQRTLPAGDNRFFLVAGVNQSTVTGVRRSDTEFVYTVSREGDGTVPLAFARLAGIPEAQTYYVEESHGSLPNNELVEQAVADLLARGTTSVLPNILPAIRREAAQVHESQIWTQGIGIEGHVSVAASARDVLRSVAAPEAARVAQPAAAKAMAAAATGASVVTAPALHFQRLFVAHHRRPQMELRCARGSITQVDSRAYVLGMFKNVVPSGAANAIDQRLRGAIREFTERRMFIGEVGEIFTLPVGRNSLRADMVVFAGLGSFDQFDSNVQEMVAENIMRVLVRTRVEEFATVLMGAATTGDRIGRLLEALLRGFIHGLKEADRERRFRGITLCESDPQRLEEIKSELYRLSSTSLFDEIDVTLDEFELELEEAVIISGARAIRPAREPVYLLCRQEQRSGHVSLRSSVLSTSARATLVTQEQEIDTAALDTQLAELEQVTRGPASALDSFGETLAETVLSPRVRAELLRSTDRHLVVVHDEASSRIPWETLRLRPDGGQQSWAPAESMGLSHRLESGNLSVATWPEQKRYQPGIHILLIVDPKSNLEGAVKEGQRLMEIASQTAGITVKKLLQGQATLDAVLKELRSGEYDVVHYAGHAFFDESRPSDSGLVLADGNLLGSDLSKILSLPSLVFFNACEAARLRGEGTETPRHPAKARDTRVHQQVGIAEALLRGGVANFLGTYWPLSDTAATQFSTQFYQALLAGWCLGDAIQEGRHAVQKAQSSDWADYVFYGSHDFNLKVAGA